MNISLYYQKTVIWSLAFVTTFLFFSLLHPISQDMHYHIFAGEKKIHGIPNFYNVMSNIAFILIGLFGFFQNFILYKRNSLKVILCIGIFTTGIGSSYYHWNPTLETLFWDRLPMTIVFMSFFGIFYGKYFSMKEGKTVGFIGLISGILSVLYWIYTEKYSHGDLRPYALIQFLPILLMIIILLMNWNTVKEFRNYVLLAFFFYLFAKIGEHFDSEILDFLQIGISGHPLKHILASISCFYIVKSSEIDSLDENQMNLR